MIWIYITLDIFLFALMSFLVFLLFRFWTKKKRMNHSPLSQFRNDDLYEKSLEDKRRLAHIEDQIAEEDYIDVVVDDEIDTPISDDDISFSDGYGKGTGLEDEYGN